MKAKLFYAVALALTVFSPFARADARTEMPIFDPVYYSDTYEDLYNAFGYDAEKLKNHWLTFGIKEGRKSSAEFDIQCYLKNYDDLRKAFGRRNYFAAVNHYITFGKKEGRKTTCD